jgi:hypothetical protein
MSFLAPLFLVGLAALAAPILMHMIRREAKGQQTFGSLIFLEASPPTMMRRSRIEHWLLLLLRSLAILLLVAAFARPYWRMAASPPMVTAHPRRVILLDRSASMSRAGIWDKASERVRQIIEETPPEISLGLYTFSHDLLPVLEVDVAGPPPSERRGLLLSRLMLLRPDDGGTDLGSALAALAGQLETEGAEAEEQDVPSEIVLVSDLQAGSQVDALANYPWPKNCCLRIEKISAVESSNLSTAFLDIEEDAQPIEEIPIRLFNRGGDARQTAELQWLDATGQPLGKAGLQREVAANQGLVVRMPKLDQPQGILEVRGDQATFDNRRWFAQVPEKAMGWVCLDTASGNTAEDLGFFLEQLPLDKAERKVSFSRRLPGSAEAWPATSQVPLVVASHRLTGRDAARWRKELEQGQHGLWVLDAAMEDKAVRAEFESAWENLVGSRLAGLSEADSQQDALLERIDFNDPIFRSLADSRFNDFTKIRFWHHRRIELDPATPWRMVGWFDDDSPALMNLPVGRGQLWVLAAGWQPRESQLALSSKFVPILSAIFDNAAPRERFAQALETGNRIVIGEDEQWLDPSGQEIQSTSAENSSRSFIADKLGFYQLSQAGSSRKLACNLPIAESDTRDLELEKLERLGVNIGLLPTPEKQQRQAEQQQLVELEKQQQLWRWCMASMLGVIALESILAFRR